MRTCGAGARAGLCRMAALVLAMALGAGGCLDDGAASAPLIRTAVSGDVTLDGKPLSSGSIQFDPLNEQGGTAVSGAIKEGSYAIDAAIGPVPGKYRVRISSRPTSEVDATENPGPIARRAAETVPKTYNRESKTEIEVKGSDPQKFNFELKANP